MSEIHQSNPSCNLSREPYSLAILLDRAQMMAARVRAGQVSFIDAVDMAYSAADMSGLIQHYGDDRIQAVLAQAFMGVRP
jgi:hypothetical protein